MTADHLDMVDGRLASIDETLRQYDDVVAGRASAPGHSGGERSGAAIPRGPAPVSCLDLRPGVASDPLPAVLLETWRPVTFHADGRVEIGAPRCGPARSDQQFPPATIRCTDAMLCGLFDALWPVRHAARRGAAGQSGRR